MQKANKMIKITDAAKEKIKVIQHKISVPGVTSRIIKTSIPKKLDLILGIEKEEDHIVVNTDGKKILLIGPEVATLFEGKVIDYKEKKGFIVSKDKGI